MAGKRPPRPRTSLVRLTEQQKYLFQRKCAVRKESEQHVLTSAINDYLLGEWEPEMRPALSRERQIAAYEVWGEGGFDPRDGIDPEQVDPDDQAIDLQDLQEGPSFWDLRDLVVHLQEQLGREIRVSTLYKLLQKHFPREPGQWQYSWSGASDPQIPEIVALVEAGEMERLRDESLSRIYQGPKVEPPDRRLVTKPTPKTTPRDKRRKDSDA